MTPDEVLQARFTATKFRMGYDQDEVDDFLDEVVNALHAQEAGLPPTLTSGQVLNKKFSATKFREGYDQDEVDDYLDRVAAALGPETVRSEAVRRDISSAGPTTDTEIPGLIAPRRRWFGRRG